MGRIKVKPKKERAAKKAATVNRDAEYKPLWLNLDEVAFLTGLIEGHDPEHHMLVKLAKVKQELTDRMLQLLEMVARSKATAHWEEPENSVNARLEADRKAFTKRKGKAEAKVAAISATQLKKLLKAQKKEQARAAKAASRLAKQTQSQARLVEQTDQGIVPHAQQHGSLPASVASNEGQQFEIGDGHRGGGGSAEIPVAAEGCSGLVLPLPPSDHAGSLGTSPK